MITAEEYFDEYSKREGFKDTSDMVRFCNEWSNNHLIEASKEYSVIYAEQEKENIRQFLISEGFEILAEKI